MNENYTPLNDEEAEFLKNYQPGKYAPMAVTVDNVIFTIHHNELSVLLIKRGGHPYKDHWALPGGFKNPNESLQEAALRELKEETDLDPEHVHLEQLGSYGDPGRDPRMDVVSVAFVALGPNPGDPTGGDDASDARFFAVRDILSPADEEDRVLLAFDHLQIIRDGWERAAAKLEYTPLATAFLDEQFTLADLRRVYEKVWLIPEGQIHASGFRRKVLSTPGFIEPVGTKGESQFPNGRSADLYRRGDVKLLHPAILRKDASLVA